MPENFDFYVGLEASAQRLTTYEPEPAPGLLPTSAYASVLIRSVYPDDGAEEHTWGVKLRMRRQMRITRKHQPATFDVILRESALHGMVGSAKVMWFKSSHSGGNANCVEVAYLPNNLVGVRDSKNPSGPTLLFTSAEWTAFTAATTRGDLTRWPRHPTRHALK